MRQRKQWAGWLALLLTLQLLLPAITANAAADSGTLLPPSNVAAQNVTPSDIKLTWSPVYSATGYNVYSIVYGSMDLVGTTATTSFSLSGLSEGSYSYVVSTLSSGSESGPGAPVTVTVTYPELAAPASFTYAIQNGNDIVLSWGAVQYAQTYNLYQVGSDGSNTLLYSGAARTYTIPNAPDGNYTYTVSASHSKYGVSPETAPLKVAVARPTMTAPAGFKAALSNLVDVTLSWSAVPFATNYKIYQVTEGEKVLKSTITATSVKYTNLPAGDYVYEVHSNSDRFGESADGSQASITVGTVTMAPPASVTFKLQNLNDVVLSWTASANATAYKIYQIVDGQPVLKSTVTGLTATYAKMPAGDYTYEVRAYSDRFGESNGGTQVNVTVSDVVMEAPLNVAYNIVNGNDIVLTWDAAANATNYKIYLVANGQETLKNTITGRTITYANQPAGEYTYKVYSYSTRFGESAEGSSISVSLVHPVMVPPANVTQTVKSATSFALNWDAVTYATSYKVYIIDNGQKVLKSTVTTPTVTYTGVAPGTYTYEINTFSSRFGESAAGTRVEVTMNGETMQAPGNPTYTVEYINDYTLKWTASANATGYKVYQIIDGERVLKSTVSGLSVSYTYLPEGNYEYVVHSYSTLLGESPEGAKISFTVVWPEISPPSNVTYKVQNGNDVVVSWAAVANVNGYKVYEVLDGQTILKATVTVPAVTTTITDVTAGKHVYEIRSFRNRFGESKTKSQLSLDMVYPVVQSPANLTYTISNGNDVTLKWNAALYASSYKVYRVVDGNKVLVSTVTGTSTTYAKMQAGTYNYVVYAVSNRFGESPNGSPIEVNVAEHTMEAPNNLVYTVTNGNDITLKWDAVTYAASYNVYEISGDQRTLKKTVTTTSASFVNMPAGDYKYEVRSLSMRFGESPEGAQIAYAVVLPVMQAPGNLTFSVANGNDLTLKWEATTYATSYNVYQVIDGERSLKRTVSTLAAAFTNMPAGDYLYEVRSVSTRFGESPEGAQIAFAVVYPIMQAPGNLTQSIANGNDFTIRWSAVTYATAYKVYQVVDGLRVLKATVTSTSASFPNMPQGDYTYEVNSFSSRFGESPVAGKIDFLLKWPVLQAPQLKGTVFNANNITFTWQSAAWANEYRVYEVTAGNRQLVYKGTALTSKVYNLSEETHSYEMTIYSNRFGESAPSPVYAETIVYPTMQAPEATLTLTSSTSARIYWNFVTYANGYNIYELVNGQPVEIARNINNLSYTISNLSYADHQYYVTSYSNSFGESAASNIVLAKLIVDTEAPVTKANAPASWSNQDVVVTLSATDNETGVVQTYYSLNGSAYVPGNSFTVSQEGITKVSYYSVDKVGNQETPTTIDVKIDRTAPVTTASAPVGWSKEEVTVSLTAEDSGSGVAKTYYSVNDGEYVEGTTVKLSQEGVSKVSFYSVDAAGNAEAAQSIDVSIDRTAPVTTASAPTGWSKEEVTVSLTAEDSGSGVAKTYYSVNGGEYVEGTTVKLSQEGVSKVSFYSVDAAGNAEAAQFIDVSIDRTPPVTTASAPAGWSKDEVTVSLTAEDSGSGVAKTYYSVNGGEYVEGTTVKLSQEGVSKVSFYSVDAAGNAEAAQDVSVQIDKTAPLIDMVVEPEYGLGSVVPLNFTATDSLSGIINSVMTVKYPNSASAVTKESGESISLNVPGTYTVEVTATNGAGLSTKIVKQFSVYIPATITVTPTVIKGNNGVFTVRVDLPSGYSTAGFNLDSVRLNGVKALTSNNGYYNQAKNGQFKFERSDFAWSGSEAVLHFTGLVNGNEVSGQTTVKLQK
ncbi:OmpL47-type beta-barrel domain-containing protein [Paenibacillus chartarius]|uniref:OmpL47-type beta-barrel domain-containing protein n=1 Tax=Paenibacillus chartarius TaxID=747481 RepID=A0ABV6DGQ3_9BACL